MKKVLKYTLPVCISAFSFAQETPKFEDRKRVEKALKNYKIDLINVDIETSYQSEEMGGFIAGIRVKKPIKVLKNTLEKDTQITLTNDSISYIGLGYEEKTPLFKLDGVVC